MKKLWAILMVFLVLSCKEQKEGEKIVTEPDPTIFNGVYMDFREMDAFEGYEKVSDTSIYVDGNDNPAFRLTQLKNNRQTMILFSKVNSYEQQKENKTVLDTLMVSGMAKEDYFSIGYCSLGGKYEQEIVAIVKPTKEKNIEKVVKAWRANMESEELEEISNLDSLTCLNERFGEVGER